MKKAIDLFIIAFAVVVIPTFGEIPSLGVPDAAWKAKTLRACWQSDEDRLSREAGGWTTLNYRAEVPAPTFQRKYAKWIGDAFRADRIGVSLEGFGPCPDEESELEKYTVYLVNQAVLIEWGFHLPRIAPFAGIATLGDRNRYELPRFYRRWEWGAEFPYLPTLSPIGAPVPYRAAIGYHFSYVNDSVSRFFTRTVHGIERSLGLDPHTEMPTDVQMLIRAEAALEVERATEDGRHYVALHEVGHLLGLLHEDRRTGSRQRRPRYCAASLDAENENDLSFPIVERRFGTEYDPFSIMSYCRETMHNLFHRARLVCRLAAPLGPQFRKPIANFLKTCPEIEHLEFPVDLTKRDVTGLRAMYLNDATGAGEWVDYRASPIEKRLAEILDAASRLPFDSKMTALIKTVVKNAPRPSTPTNTRPSR